MLKTFGLALLLASGLAIAGAPVRALQIVVTQVDKNTDGSMTYHFAVKTDQGETLAPGEFKETSDFVTIYNFYGLVDGWRNRRRAGNSRLRSSAEPRIGMDTRWYCRWMSRVRPT